MTAVLFRSYSGHDRAPARGRSYDDLEALSYALYSGCSENGISHKIITYIINIAVLFFDKSEAGKSDARKPAAVRHTSPNVLEIILCSVHNENVVGIK